MTTAFESLLGPEPTWLKCACGAMTSRVPCWECERVAAARADAARARGLAIATIPKRFAWADVGAPSLADRVRIAPDKAGHRKPLAEVIRHVLASSHVVFAGPSGSGKTSLACACLRERVPHGVYMTASRVGVARNQAGLGKGEAGDVERAMTAQLLLLDELCDGGPAANIVVRDVLLARHDADLPTWFTTGLSADQLGAMYGDGALRRLVGEAYIVKLGGEA